jgi:hypothetical protein
VEGGKGGSGRGKGGEWKGERGGMEGGKGGWLLSLSLKHGIQNPLAGSGDCRPKPRRDICKSKRGSPTVFFCQCANARVEGQKS